MCTITKIKVSPRFLPALKEVVSCDSSQDEDLQPQTQRKLFQSRDPATLTAFEARSVTFCMHKKKKIPERVFHTTHCMQILKKLVHKETYNNFSSEIEHTECHMLHAQEKQTLRKFSITLIA
jgi:hypothetical protein